MCLSLLQVRHFWLVHWFKDKHKSPILKRDNKKYSAWANSCIIRKNQKRLKTTSGLYYKSFTIVIYDRNDSSQYDKTMTMIISYAPKLALALASVINYDHKWCHNLKHHLLTIVMCLWYRPQNIIVTEKSLITLRQELLVLF